MKMSRYVIILTSVLTLLSACGESLKDTYKEWAGDGEIRYLGKCTDLLVTPGWKRIIVTWENNMDPAIQQVKVAWMLDAVRDSVLLERGTTEYSIRELDGEPLRDGNYEISVSAVSEEKSSIPVMTVGRPYTYTHEDIMTFNLMISRLFTVNDRLVLFFAPWNDNILEASLNYTKKDGTTGKLELTKEFYDAMRAKNNGLYWLLDDAVAPSSQFVLNRRAVLPNCDDEIVFEPHVFDTGTRYDADFVQSIQSQFGYSEIPHIWADTVQTVYMDRSLGSFSSFLNLPKLNKLVLGGRRYLSSGAVNDAIWGQCSVSDKPASDFVLKVLNELNGLEVHRYNKHFSMLTPAPYILEKGAPTLPDVDFIDLTDLQFTQSPESTTYSRLPDLTDGDYSTSWKPSPLARFAAYELTLDLKSPKTINGLCFVQTTFGTSALVELAYVPEYVVIQVSANGGIWEDATYAMETRLGKSNGEINYIPFSKEIRAGAYRYVRLLINPTLYGDFYESTIAEIRLY